MTNSYFLRDTYKRVAQFEVLESKELLAGDAFSAIDSIRAAALRLPIAQVVEPVSMQADSQVVAKASTSSKPRLLILTDIGGGDPDDEQSLVRLLTYANEFRIEGIIAGDSLTGTGDVNDAKIRNIISHYESVQNNLSRHATGYPTASYLRSKVARGQPTGSLFGEAHDTDGSNLIIHAVDGSSERLNIAIWGGSADLAQALWRVRNDRSSSQVDAFVAKLRVTWIEQGPTDAWIKSNFPDMWVVSNIVSGDPLYQAPFRGMYLGGDTSLVTRTWVQENVKSHHPYGTPYPETAAGAAMKEGDTPTWFYFLPSNLSDPDHPEWGGWGGRYESNGSVYSPGRDDVGNGSFGRDTVNRWRLEFQNDFSARMDWTQVSYSEANHNPIAQINVPNQITVSAGQSISIDAASSWDPDGDTLGYEWFQYREAGSYPNAITLSNASTARVSFQAPEVSSTQTLHLILKLRDNGGPNLFDYQRVIVTVRPANSSAPVQTPTSTASTGPVIDLRFDEGSGTTSVDFSGSGNDAQLVRIESDDWVAGKAGRAIRLDGTDEYARVPQSSSWGGRQTNLSVSAWVKFDDFSNTDYKPLVGVGSWTDQRLYIYPVDGRLQFSAASDGWKTGALSSPLSFLQQPDNQFHHIVAVKDEANHSASIYVDGALVGNDDYASGIVDLNGWDLNICGNSGPQISCELDGFTLHHEALSSSRVSQLYQAGAAASPNNGTASSSTPTAVIDLAFSEGAGLTSTDRSGNGNTGLLLNTESTDWTTGRSGGAVRLDNVDERVRVLPSSTWASQQESFSVATWVRLDQLSSTNYDSIVSVGQWDDQRLNIYPIDGRLQFAALSSGWGTAVLSTPLPFLQHADNRFHHIVAVKDSENHSASLYVDGNLVGHDPYASGGVDLHGYDFSLCSDSTGSRQIACVVDGATLYHGALDASMVSELYAAVEEGTIETPQSNNGAVVDLKFNEGSGNTTQDLSGNGNTGHIANIEAFDWVNTPTVTSLNLDGVDEQVRVRPSASWSKPQTDFTLSVWLKFSDPANSNYTSIASVGSWDDQRLNLYRADGRLHFVAQSNESATGITTPPFSFLWWPDGRYHHLVAVKDSATQSASLYVDGRLVGTDDHSIGSVDLRDWDLTFGGNSEGNKMMPITLGEAMLFDRAFSEVEVEQLNRDFWA